MNTEVIPLSTAPMELENMSNEMSLFSEPLSPTIYFGIDF